MLYSVGFNRQDDGGRLHELGYAFPYPDEVGDLNFREGSRLYFVERDAELTKQAEAEK